MRIQLFYIYGVTFVCAVIVLSGFAVILFLRSELDARFIIPGLVSLLTCIVFFGSSALLATLWFHNSILGSLIGAIIVFFAFLLLPPAQQGGYTFAWAFDFLDTYRRPTEWWAIRLIYLGTGVLGLIISWRLLGNTERLLGISAERKLHNREANALSGFLTKQVLHFWRALHQRIETLIALTRHSAVAQLIYQVMIELRSGRLFLFNGALLLLWLILAMTSPTRGAIGYRASAYHFLGQYFGIVAILYPFFLAWIVFDSFARNRSQQLEQLALSIIRPKRYLLSFLFSTFIAAMVSVVILSAPPFIIMLLLSSSFTPSFLLNHFAAYLAIVIYGVGASTIYTAGAALLISSVTNPQFESATKVTISIVIWIAVTITRQSVLGSLIIPSLDMAYRTSTHWLITAAQLPLIVRDPPGPIVDASLLIFPLVSALLQITVLWFIVSKIYERRVRFT